MKRHKKSYRTIEPNRNNTSLSSGSSMLMMLDQWALFLLCWIKYLVRLILFLPQLKKWLLFIFKSSMGPREASGSSFRSSACSELHPGWWSWQRASEITKMKEDSHRVEEAETIAGRVIVESIEILEFQDDVNTWRSVYRLWLSDLFRRTDTTATRRLIYRSP